MIEWLRTVRKFVRMYPEPFVTALSVLVILAGVTGTVLDLVMPVPAFILVFGVGLWSFQDEVADRIRVNPMQEMMNNFQQAIEEVSEE